MHLEIRDLRLVAIVADVGSLTKAGQQLHLTQSALSHQLADLERRIGGALFERAGRRMILTPLGEHLRTRARRTLVELREIEDDIATMAAGRNAVLRIATECYTCYHWLPSVLEAFRQRHPAVEVRIAAAETAWPIRALLARRLDLCIVTSRVTDRRIVTTPLFNDELVLVVAAAHPLASRRSVSAPELKSEHFLMYSGPEDNLVFQHVLAPAGVSPTQLLVLQLTEAIIELVKANLGVTILARWVVQPYLASGALKAVRVDHPRVSRTWKVATRDGRSSPAHVTDFVQFLTNAVIARRSAHADFAQLRSASRLGARTRAVGTE